MIRLLLEAYYEPRFSGRSHGFRLRRGCHTALSEIADLWTGTTWFIEGDVADCFGSIDHEVMLSILAEKIHDNRFLRLIKQMLQAGYLEDWTWNATLSGAPQGGVVSPILSNIYLDRLDRFVETVLIPEYTQGKGRRKNPGYDKVCKAVRRARDRGDRAAVRELRKQQRRLPYGDPQDPSYRRLRYSRYADDHLLGFVGPKAEAEQIKGRLTTFLRDTLKLELSADKTLITHARTRAARYLGYEITVQHANSKITNGRRSANAKIALRVPAEVITAKCAPYRRRGEPAYRPELLSYDDHIIVGTYGSEYRGIVQYYLLAGNVWRLNRLEWVAKTSMLKTLAYKHRSTVMKMARKHKTVIVTSRGPRTCYEATMHRAGRKPLVGRFGGIPLARQRKAVINDRLPVPTTGRRKELIQRLLTGRCEWCGRRAHVEAHQVRKLADLTTPGRPQPEWKQLMATKRRKTLIVCTECHHAIHARQPTATLTK